MDKEIIDYIFHYSYKIMTENEANAWIYYVGQRKIAHLEGEEKQRRIESMTRMGWNDKNQEALDLLKDGIEKFKENTVKRLLSENPKLLNYCPKCGKLARTPFAKQCRYCGHDWH